MVLRFLGLQRDRTRTQTEGNGFANCETCGDRLCCFVAWTTLWVLVPNALTAPRIWICFAALGLGVLTGIKYFLEKIQGWFSEGRQILALRRAAASQTSTLAKVADVEV